MGATAMAGAGMASSAIGSIMAAQGQQQAGEAQAQADIYNSEVAQNNAQVARNNAQLAALSGEQQAATQGLKNRAELGAIKANQGASGIDVNSGSAVDVRSSAAELGELDAINIRANAAREAYAYQNQATSYEDQAALDQASAGNAKEAGQIGEETTLLSGFGSGANNFARFMQQSSPLSMNSGADTAVGH